MFPEVDIEKSINRGRLIYKMSFRFFLNFILPYPFILMGLSVFALTIFNEFKVDIESAILYSMIFIPLCAWTMSNIFLLNKLVKVGGKQLNFNREKMLNIIADVNSNMETQWDEPNCIITIFRGGFFSSGYVLTILFDGNNVYLNRSAFGRGGLISPFHATYCYYQCKDLAIQLERAILQ